MHATRGELDFSLDDLQGRLPKLMRDHAVVVEFWAVFHAYADPIVDDASPEDAPYVLERIRSMLADKDLTSPFDIETERYRTDAD